MGRAASLQSMQKVGLEHACISHGGEPRAKGMILLHLPSLPAAANNGGCHSWKWKIGRWQSHLAMEELEERYARYRNCERYTAYASSRPTCHALSIRGRVRRNAEGERQSFDLQKSNLFTVEGRETDWASCKNSIWSIHIRVVSAAQWIEREASNDVIGVTTGRR